MADIPDAPWIGLDEEEYLKLGNPYYDWEERDNYEAEQADMRWKERQEERDD